MTISQFTSVAPYLKDPLILIGFFLFLAFLFLRTLLKTGVIPTLNQDQGLKTIRWNDATWQELAGVLASERYSYNLMVAYSKNIVDAITDVNQIKRKLDMDTENL